MDVLVLEIDWGVGSHKQAVFDPALEGASNT